ncbi:DNA-binding protein [Hapalosiphon sp. MRB220]|nr:DNA-binding protein [Hapalosiphon sp. MRB220]
MTKDIKSVIDEFHSSVNMTVKELQSWLQTEEAQSVGQKDGDSESIGHKSGKQIVKLVENKKDEYNDDEISHMKKVISYIHRHLAQKPSGNIKNTHWRYSLMNWGHDPLKDENS